MTHPHRQCTPGIPLCECGAMPSSGPTSTWGADCPVAMRERIGELERERAEARASALHEAVAVLRRLSNDYAAGHRDHYDYCRVLSVATARIEALTTATNRSDDAR